MTLMEDRLMVFRSPWDAARWLAFDHLVNPEEPQLRVVRDGRV